MTPGEFETALAATRLHKSGPAARGAYLAICTGATITQAARAVGLHRSVVSRAVARIRPTRTCPHCHGAGVIAKS